MTHKGNGRSWFGKRVPEERLFRWFRLGRNLLALILLVEIGRRLLLSHSVYALNVRSNAMLGDMPAPTKGQRILVFAPHEDDETLGCGGYLQQAVDAGADVHIVLMTNGEYPELSLILEERLPVNAKAFIDLGYVRQHETLTAMGSLGIPADAVTFLGYPNQYLDKMWQPEHWQPDNPVRSIRLHATESPYRNALTPHTVFCGSAMLRDVEAILLREHPDVIITLHPDDIHPDHWPTGAIVRYALAELAANGQSFAQKCSQYYYLIHRDGWPVPRRYRPTAPLDPPYSQANVIGEEWLALPLTVAQTIDKYKAIEHYRSQAAAMDPLLHSFDRANELFSTISDKNWPSGMELPLTTVVESRAADRVNAIQHPPASIHQVGIARDGDHLIVEIRPHHAPSPAFGYHFSLHAIAGPDPHRLLAAYHVINGHPSGVVLTRNTLVAVSNNDMTAVFSGEMLRIAMPWPIKDGEPLFMLLRVWTTHEKEIVDDTGEISYRIHPAGK